MTGLTAHFESLFDCYSKSISSDEILAVSVLGDNSSSSSAVKYDTISSGSVISFRRRGL